MSALKRTRSLGVVVVAAIIALTAAAPQAALPKPQISFTRLSTSIYLASSDGSHVHVVLRGAGNVSYGEPAWSRAGRLAATRDFFPGTHSYSTVIVVRRGKKPLSVPKVGSDFDHEPSWAPNGRWLALTMDAGQFGGGLYVSTPAGKERRVGSISAVESPDWSPDGKLIAFSQGQFTPEPPEIAEYITSYLFVIRPNGSGVRRLTSTSAFHPSWSPDSRWLAFDDGSSINVVRSDGANKHKLAQGYDPDWSPNGRQIAFVRGSSIWVMDADGRNQRLLVRHGQQPAWNPG